MAGGIRFASVTTTEHNLQRARQTLVDELTARLDGAPVDFAIAFLSPHFARGAKELSQTLRDSIAPRVLIGCTGEGIIGSEEEIEQSPAISIVAARLPGVELTPFVIRAVDMRRAFTSSESVLEGIDVPEATKLFLMIADPFTSPMDPLLKTFNTSFPGVPIIGGMASGSPVPGRNVLLFNNMVISDGAVAVAFSGDVDVDVIVSQGCRPVGSPLEVTRASDNVIKHLEGKPPLDHLQDIVTEMADDEKRLLRNGLFIGRAVDPDKEVLGRGDFLIRGVMGVDQDNGAITVGDFIDEGEIVQFHVRDAETAREDLEMMLTPQSLFSQPSGAFLFSCNGRGTRLYDHPNGDVSAIQGFFPGINLAGFFCAGEIGPIGGRNFLHGHTASLALIRPSATARPEL